MQPEAAAREKVQRPRGPYPETPFGGPHPRGLQRLSTRGEPGTRDAQAPSRSAPRVAQPIPAPRSLPAGPRAGSRGGSARTKLLLVGAAPPRQSPTVHSPERRGGCWPSPGLITPESPACLRGASTFPVVLLSGFQQPPARLELKQLDPRSDRCPASFQRVRRAGGSILPNPREQSLWRTRG